MGYLLQFVAVQALVALLGIIPLFVSGWFVSRVADVYWFSSPKRRKISLDNLTLAFGAELSPAQKRTTARKAFQSQALSFLELFLIKKMKKGAARRFSITGREHFEAAVSRGKGVVFVASHLGSWEYIGFPGYLLRYPRAVIVKAVRNRHLNAVIDALRRTIDTLPIAKEASALRKTLAELRQNHGVAVVIDQWPGDEGTWIEFFGRPASTTTLPARLARKTGCALIPIYCLRKKMGQYDIEVLPEVRLSDDPEWETQTTQRLNDILESQVRKHPEQWSWSHRRWRPRLAPA